MKIVPRRPLDPECPNGYQESDKDFVLNNLEACVEFLEKQQYNPFRFDVELPEDLTT